MRRADRVPEHDVALFERAIRLAPLREADGLRLAVGVAAGRVPLGLVVVRDPERVARKARAPRDARFGLREHRRDAVERHQPVADLAAERIAASGIDHVPDGEPGRGDERLGSGPAEIASDSTSRTLFSTPSTSRSRRKQKKCW